MKRTVEEDQTVAKRRFITVPNASNSRNHVLHQSYFYDIAGSDISLLPDQLFLLKLAYRERKLSLVFTICHDYLQFHRTLVEAEMFRMLKVQVPKFNVDLVVSKDNEIIGRGSIKAVDQRRFDMTVDVKPINNLESLLMLPTIKYSRKETGFALIAGTMTNFRLETALSSYLRDPRNDIQLLDQILSGSKEMEENSAIFKMFMSAIDIEISLRGLPISIVGFKPDKIKHSVLNEFMGKVKKNYAGYNVRKYIRTVQAKLGKVSTLSSKVDSGDSAIDSNSNESTIGIISCHFPEASQDEFNPDANSSSETVLYFDGDQVAVEKGQTLLRFKVVLNERIEISDHSVEHNVGIQPILYQRRIGLMREFLTHKDELANDADIEQTNFEEYMPSVKRVQYESQESGPSNLVDPLTTRDIEGSKNLKTEYIVTENVQDLADFNINYNFFVEFDFHPYRAVSSDFHDSGLEQVLQFDSDTLETLLSLRWNNESNIMLIDVGNERFFININPKTKGNRVTKVKISAVSSSFSVSLDDQQPSLEAIVVRNRESSQVRVFGSDLVSKLTVSSMIPVE